MRRVGDSAFAGGALPKEDGSFRVDGLRPGRYTLRIRAIGFAPVVRNDIAITADNPIVDLGAIALKAVATKLDATQTVAEREDVVLAPDRTSYSVKNMPAASGGTAIDVLRNIPLVEVDGSNNVSLRGNANVVVQINGRSTPLKGDQLGAFLAQLPAGTVKNVEVATNPSAKDDPEGTAGIINIVLNQEAELGLSGGLTAGTASTGMVNASGNVGKQQGKLTLFVSGSIYHDERVDVGNDLANESRRPGAGVHDDAISAGKQSPISGGGTLRSEYRFTERNTLSFDGFFYGGRFGGDQSSAYTDLDAARAVIGLFDQATSQSSRNLSQDYDVTFRRLSDKNATALLDGARVLEHERQQRHRLVGQRAARRRVDAARHSDRARPHGRALSVSQLEDGLHAASSARAPSSRRDSRSRGARRRTTSTRRI